MGPNIDMHMLYQSHPIQDNQEELEKHHMDYQQDLFDYKPLEI
jgi:hypothetical protein